MSDTSNLDDLRRLSGDLSRLLADPQPGLATWCGILGTKLRAIADFAGDPTEGSVKARVTRVVQDQDFAQATLFLYETDPKCSITVPLELVPNARVGEFYILEAAKDPTKEPLSP